MIFTRPIDDAWAILWTCSKNGSSHSYQGTILDECNISKRWLLAISIGVPQCHFSRFAISTICDTNNAFIDEYTTTYWMGGFLTVDSLGTVRKPVSLHKFAKNVDFFSSIQPSSSYSLTDISRFY